MTTPASPSISSIITDTDFAFECLALSPNEQIILGCHRLQGFTAWDVSDKTQTPVYITMLQTLGGEYVQFHPQHNNIIFTAENVRGVAVYDITDLNNPITLFWNKAMGLVW